MSEAKIESVLSWMKGTDLVEVHYTDRGEVLSLRVQDAQGSVEIPPAALVPVTAPAVGVFRFGPPGRPKTAEEGASVKQGRLLGLVETGKKRTDVAATSSGRILRVLVEDGQAVEYGRPLFLIEPA